MQEQSKKSFVNNAELWAQLKTILSEKADAQSSKNQSKIDELDAKIAELTAALKT